MLNIKNNAKSTVVTTEKFLVGKANSEFVKFAEKYNGKISIVEIDGNARYKVVFNDKEHKANAEKFKKAFMRGYNANKSSDNKPKKQTKKDAPKVSKKGNAKWQKSIEKYRGKGTKVNKKVAETLRANGVCASGEYWDYWKSIR
jgi:hypothetical protein